MDVDLVIVVRLKRSTYMKGNSLCYTTSITPLLRKSTLTLSDMFADVKLDYITNLERCQDGIYTIETSYGYDEFVNLDRIEYYLKQYVENTN